MWCSKNICHTIIKKNTLIWILRDSPWSLLGCGLPKHGLPTKAHNKLNSKINLFCKLGTRRDKLLGNLIKNLHSSTQNKDMHSLCHKIKHFHLINEKAKCSRKVPTSCPILQKLWAWLIILEITRNPSLVGCPAVGIRVSKWHVQRKFVTCHTIQKYIEHEGDSFLGRGLSEHGLPRNVQNT